MGMRKTTLLLLCVVMLFLFFGCGTREAFFSDEMKFDDNVDISPSDGADFCERDADHQNSPYFKHPDFYNAVSVDSFKILPQFQTMQQSAEWSSGVACIEMVLQHYGKLGNHNEDSLAALRPNGNNAEETTLRQAMAVLERVGGTKLTTTLDYVDPAELSLKSFYEYIQNGVPVLVCWGDRGGHWMVLIGYDDMGTQAEADDVMIFADPYDTNDHNQDGYGIISAQHFFRGFAVHNSFPEEEGNEFLFIAVEAA